MKLGRFAIIVLIVVIVGGGGLLAYSTFTSREATRMRVVGATIDIPKGAVISAEMLGVTEAPRPEQGDTVLVQYVFDPDQVVGKTALQDFHPGQALDARYIGTEPPPGRAMPSGEVILPGELGVPISVDQYLAVGGAVKAGDYLTILVGEEDWEAVKTWKESVENLNEPSSPTGAEDGGLDAAAQELRPQLPLTLSKLPLKYHVFATHVQVVELRRGPLGGGTSLLRDDAKSGDTTGAYYMLLDLTADQTAALLSYMSWGKDRVVFTIEGRDPAETGP